jgi:hypothetical protein
LLAQPDRSFYVHSVPIAPPLQAILQDLRQRKSGNPVTDLLVSLLLTLLTGFFTRLSELMERIKSGDYQPPPIAPRQEPAAQRPRRRTPRQNHRWPAETRPEPAAPKAVAGTEKSPLRPRGGQGWVRWGIPATLVVKASCFRAPSPNRQKACRKRLPWHAHFVTL